MTKEKYFDEFFAEYKAFYEDIVQYICGARYVKGGQNKYERKEIEDKATIAHRGIFEKFTSIVPKEITNEKERTEAAEKLVRNYVKKLLGRLVFIQFLAKKGWMGLKPTDAWGAGNEHFLHNIYDDYQKNSGNGKFVGDVLNKVLFYSLNNTTGMDGNVAICSNEIAGTTYKFPYLNGGLFEETELDKLDINLPGNFFVSDNREYADDDPNAPRNTPRKFIETAKKKSKKKNGEESESANGYPYSASEGLFDFFERYNFTIDENGSDEAVVGIDPEMLGKIFENLLEDNKDKGAFYTPKPVVEYMCQQSLIAYLQNGVLKEKSKIGISDDEIKAQVERFVKTKEADVLPKECRDYIRQQLETVKICDPAIGSGAFPMGLLNELLACREALESSESLQGANGQHKITSRAELKKHIIQNNIYGVDIEEGAIEIARLRFWLSIVIDLDKPEALPNFDYKFMQGNSLLESYEGIDLSNLSAMKKKRKGEVSCDLFGKVEGIDKDTIYLSDTMFNFDLQRAIKDYFAVNDHNQKQEQKAEIDEYLKCVICHTLTVKAVELNGVISNLKDDYNPTARQRNLLEEKEAEYNRLQDIIKHFHSAICDKFFLWHLWFKDVFDKGGFDIVIGNPPYIRLGGTLKETYEPHKYCVPKDGKQKNKVEIEETHSFQFKTFTGDGDIYCLFYEWGYELLKDKGHLCYITSNRWLKVDYGEKLRDFLASNTNPLILIDFDGIQVFKDAQVDTNILLFAKSTNSDKTFCAVGNKDAVQVLNAIKGTLSSKVQYFLNTYTCNHYTYQNFNSSEIWIVLSPMQLRIKKQIASKGISLKDKRWNIRVNYGIKTGCNPAFIIDSVKRDNILSDCRTAAEKNKTEELIVRIVQGCDIKRYEYEWADNWLINTHNGVKQKKKIILPRIDVTEYPAVKKYLNVYLDKLKARQDKGYTPYNLRNCAYINDFNQPKIAWNVIGAAKEFAIVEGGIYVQNSIHFMVGKHLDYICAMLNSRLMQWLLSLIVGSAVGGNACNADNVTNLPIAKYDSNSQPIADIANKILIAKKQNPTADTTNYERQIDALVYELYGITSYEELLEIEGDATTALKMIVLMYIHQHPTYTEAQAIAAIQNSIASLNNPNIAVSQSDIKTAIVALINEKVILQNNLPTPTLSWKE